MPRIRVQSESTRIIRGDARQTGLPAAHFHCVATSPPYFGLREYGDDEREIGDEKTPVDYIDEMRKVGREVWRVLRDDGTWWLNLGDSFGPGKSLLMIPQRVALALQQDGWTVRAQIPWVKASCMPESVRDRPTVAHEYVFLLARSQRYFWDADAARMPVSAASVEFANRYEGGAYIAQTAKRNLDRQDHERSRMGADPATGRNLRTSDFFHAGLDEYAQHLAHVRENGGLMLSPDGDPLAFLVNPVGNKLAHFAMWPPRLVAPMIKVSTSEKGCCAKCGAQWRRVVEKGQRVVAGHRRGANSTAIKERNDNGAEAFTRWENKTLGFSTSCECNAGDPIPCRVLDPFAGSGTTMQVCEALGRDSWGVELMAKNIPIIGERLKEKLDPESLKPMNKNAKRSESKALIAS